MFKKPVDFVKLFSDWLIHIIKNWWIHPPHQLIFTVINTFSTEFCCCAIYLLVWFTRAIVWLEIYSSYYTRQNLFFLYNLQITWYGIYIVTSYCTSYCVWHDLLFSYDLWVIARDRIYSVYELSHETRFTLLLVWFTNYYTRRNLLSLWIIAWNRMKFAQFISYCTRQDKLLNLQVKELLDARL